MAKDFTKMSAKKLNALLATASDEDKVAIQNEIASREQAQEPTPTEAELTEPTPTDAELTEPTPEETQAPAESKKRVTDAERSALAEELKQNIGHKCQAVPFNSIEWVDGYIVSVLEEKRTNKVLYAIKTDDGRRIIKVSDSKLLKIFEETVTMTIKKRQKRQFDIAEWPAEEIEQEINAVISNVGKMVSWDGAAGTLSGRIVAVFPEKRARRLLYRIAIPTPIEGNPYASKIVHKMINHETLVIAEDFDEKGQSLNEKYIKRREAAAARCPVTPQERVTKCEENLKKAEETLVKAQASVEAKKKLLADAKAELDEFLSKTVESTDDLA